MAAERIIPPVCAVAADRESPRIRRRLMGAAYRRELNESELSLPGAILVQWCYGVSAGRMVGREDRNRPSAQAARRRRGGPLGGRTGQRRRGSRQVPAGRGGHEARRGPRVHRALRPPVRGARRQRAYLPLADALRGAAQAGAVRDALSSRPALSMLLPEGGGGPTIDSDRSGLARQQMFGGRASGLLTELAAAGPVLLVLEDLPLGRHLDKGPGHVPVPDAAPGTGRADRHLPDRRPCTGGTRSGRWWPSCSGCPASSRSTSPPLDPSALAEHLTAAAQGRIGATEAERHHGPGRGANAYYAEELLAASVSGDRPEQSLPAGLAALLLSRVEQLSRRRPAGAPRGGGGRPQGRRRAGPGRVGPGVGPSTRPPCGRRSPPAARTRWHRGLRIPACPPARGCLW